MTETERTEPIERTERTERTERPDLARLLGVRSGKRSYYRALVRSDERMQRAVQAMDTISRAVVRTSEGPRGLLEEVARAASSHLAAEWTLLALVDGALPDARPRFVSVDRGGHVQIDGGRLPPPMLDVLAAVRSGHVGPPIDDGWVRVLMILEGRHVGSLVALHGLGEPPEQGDLSVLRILANQAAVSLHTSEQFQSGLALHRRAQRLYDEATTQARNLAARTEQLHEAEQRLLVAHQRELIDSERHRIARELHDSVTQHVLSAGMAVEVARGEADQLGDDGRAITDQLAAAKQLTQEAVEQLRRAIYALHQPQRDTLSTLPELLHEVAEHHRPHLDITIRVEGEEIRIDDATEHEIARVVGEALFNVAMHADASRAIIRLRYRPAGIYVSVTDDGSGDPVMLSRRLRLERRVAVDGHHRGLVNMDHRIAQLGGTLAFRRARLGGVRVEIRLPLPLADRAAQFVDGAHAASDHPVAGT